MIRGERLAHRRSERLDLVSGRLFAASEHLRLQLRAEQLELVQQRSGHGLNDVPPWLYDERPDTERADTVLDEPVIRRVDQSTWKLSPPLREITRETAFHREEPTG